MSLYMFVFRPGYFFSALAILVMEILIALYVHDTFIRPYGGDFLIVILMYCCIRTFFRFRPVPVALGVLLFACLVELSQYFHLSEYLGWQDYRLARLVLGNTFEWKDMLIYACATIVIIFTEKMPVRSYFMQPHKTDR